MRTSGVLFLVGITTFLILPLPTFADNIENVDQAFEEARSQAMNENYEEAEELLLNILEATPDYEGVRVYLARVYSWTGRYEKAIEESRHVFEKNPYNHEALEVYVTVHIWQGKASEIEPWIAEMAQSFFMQDHIWIQLARLRIEKGKYIEAQEALNEAKKINPANPNIHELRAHFRNGQPLYGAKLEVTHDRFTEIFNPQTLTAFELSRETSIGPVIGRINYARRFDREGLQAEVDVYPEFTENIYAYLNAGGTSSALFPSFRLGAEPYFTLPRNFEGSAGLRYLHLSENPVWIFTASLTHYYEDWMFTLRPYMSPGEEGVSYSYNVVGRRYFSNANNYIGFQGGWGFSPEERFFQNIEEELFLIKSQYLRGEFSGELGDQWIINGALSLTRQEKAFAPGEFYLFGSGRVGLKYLW